MDTYMQLGKEMLDEAHGRPIGYITRCTQRIVVSSLFFFAFLVAGHLLLFYDLATEIEKEEPSLSFPSFLS